MKLFGFCSFLFLACCVCSLCGCVVQTIICLPMIDIMQTTVCVIVMKLLHFMFMHGLIS